MSGRGAGTVVGLLLIAAGIAAVVLLDWRPDSAPVAWRTEAVAPGVPGIGILLPPLRFNDDEGEARDGGAL